MGEAKKKGHYHPLTLAMADIRAIFDELGFEIVTGPEVETEYYNFDALNVPPDHPARDLQDTFWISKKDGKLLRTHTSPMQVRYMEEHKPPIRIISPGRAFRYEATDASHEAVFHQVEALMVDENTSLATLKGVLEIFFEKFFGKQTDVRFRPGYFPFVEPGVEVDASCFKCGGEDKECSVCRGTGWIELMGAGMVHPNVLSGVRIHPGKYQGFAFGVGIERLAMVKYGVPDVRLFLSGDLRFVNQF